MCHYDWVNKETDSPIARQDRFRWENQVKDTGKKKGRVRGVTRETWKGNRNSKIKER